MIGAAISASVAAYGATAMSIAVLAYLLGGFVKGAIGFALPTVSVAIATLALPPEVAVAYMALPGLVMNIWQSARDGMGVAVETLKEFRVVIGVMLVSLFASTQLLPHLEPRVFYIIMGLGLSSFAIVQLFGWRPTNPPRPAADIFAGTTGGFFGGISGAWGPPILMMLMSLNLTKRVFVRTCGVTFLLGAIPFIGGHASTGVLNKTTATISALMLIPAAIGMRLGQTIQDRLPAETFRKIILTVLVLAGLNFLRRAFFSG